MDEQLLYREGLNIQNSGYAWSKNDPHSNKIVIVCKIQEHISQNTVICPKIKSFIYYKNNSWTFRKCRLACINMEMIPVILSSNWFYLMNQIQKIILEWIIFIKFLLHANPWLIWFICTEFILFNELTNSGKSVILISWFYVMKLNDMTIVGQLENRRNL